MGDQQSVSVENGNKEEQTRRVVGLSGTATGGDAGVIAARFAALTGGRARIASSSFEFAQATGGLTAR